MIGSMSQATGPQDIAQPPCKLGSRENPAHCDGWGFRSEAAVAVDGRYVGVNLHPIASELSAWLAQKGQITYFTETTKSEFGAFTNPHTYAASSLSRQLMAMINDADAASEEEGDAGSHDAEVDRIRRTSEFTLAAARFVEAATRQLLHCTDFPAKSQKNAALGNLVATECRVCSGAGRPGRMISLIGSLAHRYGECREVDACLAPYLRSLNNQRAGEAAHAEAPTIMDLTAEDSRALLAKELRARAEVFQHALTHLGRVEMAMFSDITGLIHKIRLEAVLNASAEASLDSAAPPDEPCEDASQGSEAAVPPVG